MRFGWRSRAQVELLDAVRTELATAREQIATGVANSVAALEQQLVADQERQQDVATTLLQGLEALRAASLTQGGEIVAALDRIGSTWDELTVSARNQHDGLVATLGRLTTVLEQRQTAEPPSPAARVLGGTIDAAHEPAEPPTATERSRTGRATIVLDGVEVRCRFGDNQWVSGFEVCDVFNEAGTLRYRLRRRSDGYVLPSLFDETAIREARSTPAYRNDEAIR